MDNKTLEMLFVKQKLNDYYEWLELEDDNYIIDYKDSFLLMFSQHFEKEKQFFRFMKYIGNGKWCKGLNILRRGDKKFFELHNLYFGTNF